MHHAQKLYWLAAAVAVGSTACASVGGTSGGVGGTPAVAEPPGGDAAQGEGGPDRFVSAQAYQHYLVARMAQYDGDDAQAADELRVALVHDAGSPFLHVELASVMHRLRQDDRAAAECDAALELDPRYVPALLTRAKLYLVAEQPGPAIDLLKRARESDATDEEAHALLADALGAEGDEAGRLGALEAWAAAVPASSEAQLRLGRAYLERGDLDRAAVPFQHVLEREPTHEHAVRGLAMIRELQADFPGALAVYEGALHYEGNNPAFLFGAGRYYLKLHDAKSAAGYFTQVVGLTPDDPRWLERIGEAYLEAHLPDDALAYFRNLASLHADDPIAQLALGRALVAAKRPQEALGALRAVPENPAEPGPWLLAQTLLGLALRDLGRYGEAETVLRAASDKFPQEADLYDALASVYERQGDLKRAVEVLRQALRVAPADERLLYALGAIYERNGDAEKGLEHMQELLRRNPSNASALNFVGYTYAEKGLRLEEAEGLVRRALELRPGDGYITDSLGWVYFKKGDFPRAVRELSRANELSPDEPTILEHLGDALHAVGKDDRAAQVYRQALALSPETKVRDELETRLRGLGLEPGAVAPGALTPGAVAPQAPGAPRGTAPASAPHP